MKNLLIIGCLILALASSPTAFADDAPAKRLLLLGQGPDGHPPSTHEYMAGQAIIRECLLGVPGLEMTTVRADGPWSEGPELLDRADGVVLFVSQGAKWIQDDPRRYDAFARLAARGGGLVVLHWGMGTKDAQYIDRFVRLFGACHGGDDRRYKVLTTDVKVADPTHPITAGIEDFNVREEFYYRLKLVSPEESVRPLLKAKIEGEWETVCWAWDRPDGGRSFGFSGLHFHDNWRRESYRRLVAQAVLWTLKMPVGSDGLSVEVSDETLRLP